MEGLAQVGPALVPGGRKLLLEALEAAARDVGHQRVAIAEMAVGSGGAHARLPRGLGEGEAGRPLLGDEVEGGIHQGFPQVAVVIAAPPAAAVPMPAHGVGSSTSVTRDRRQPLGARVVAGTTG